MNARDDHGVMGLPPAPTPLAALLETRGVPIAALALIAEIQEGHAGRIVRGKVKPRGTTAARMAKGLGIGFSTMRRLLDDTWAAAHPDEVPAR